MRSQDLKLPDDVLQHVVIGNLRHSLSLFKCAAMSLESGSLHGTFTLMKKRNTLFCEVYRLAVLYDRLAVSCCQKVNV